jgi:ribonuclease Z
MIVLERAGLQILASPVKHVIPTLGLRFLQQGKPLFAYSCDTEPCAAVVKLAEGSPILIHEATGDGVGHSSAAQAGEIASESGTNTLYLVHYPVGEPNEEQLMEEARATFDGEVIIARDWMTVEL